MDHKKKYHGGLKVLLLPLFIMLLGMFSTSYAYVSQDYVDYALDTLLENGNWVSTEGYSHETAMKGGLNKLKENNILLKTKINEMLDYYSIPDIPDRNIMFFMLDNGTAIYLRVAVSNCTYPGNYDLGYLRLATEQFSSYDPDNPSNNTDYIYGLECVADSNSVRGWSNFSLTVNNIKQWTANKNGYVWSQDLTSITFTNMVACGIPVIYSYNPMTNLATSTNNLRSAFVFGAGGNYQPTSTDPEEPSGDNTISGTGTITNNSGDTTGKIDLSGIEQGIGNIQNQISGDTQKVIENQNQNTETIINTISGEVGKITNVLTDDADNTIDNTKITSGDIENALGFEIAQDPYSNFWTTLTNNLKNALLGTKRSIDISFQGRTWTISLDEYMVLPAWLTIILIPFSIAFFTWVLVRQWKHIFDKLSSGNIDSILKENSEERHF